MSVIKRSFACSFQQGRHKCKQLDFAKPNSKVPMPDGRWLKLAFAICLLAMSPDKMLFDTTHGY